MPGQAGSSRAAADQLFDNHRMEIVHGIGLNGRGVFPSEAELLHAAFLLPGREADLLFQSLGAQIAVTHDALWVTSAATAKLGAAGDDKGRCRGRARTREGEGVERWLGRRINFGADVAARDRIDAAAVVNAPLGKRLDVVLVELEKPVLRERRRRP